MTDPSHLKDFPDVSNKLSVPGKKSLFERQKAEAEAKRKKEAAETAAVYEDFLKSFDHDEDNRTSSRHSGHSGQGGLPPSGPRGGFGGAQKRHFVPSNVLKSGPGSLGPAPPSRKRAHDGSYTQPKENRAVFMLEEVSTPKDTKAAFGHSDDEDEQDAEERAAPKPTLHLSQLPPGTSVAVIKALMPSNITVDGVRFLPHTTSLGERKYIAAIVTLAKETPASEIDAAVTTLQNKYLGMGYNLSINRHLSSSVIQPGPILSSSASQPFGAKPVGPVNYGRLPPSMHRTYAPPQSYGIQRERERSSFQVMVNPPTDIQQLKLIHKTAEAVMKHGPAFEALLMSRVSIQRDEKWAWLWDARSPAGVWYRWRLWEMLSGSAGDSSRNAAAPPQVFDEGATWLPPDRDLPFEFTTQFEDFVSDRDYDSSEEEESGDEGAQPSGEGENAEYLNPLKKAKLTHLLTRLPPTTARLRKGDVARVTAFAINHAGRGSDEIVQLLIDNVERPFVYSSANYDRNRHDDYQSSAMDEDSGNEKKEKEKEDQTSAKLIALYIISDLLSSSSTSGVRHAWRYRQLFETALQSRNAFKKLGLVEREMGWGRLKAEKWRRAVTQVLSLWEGWCVFSSTAQEKLLQDFIDSADAKAEKMEMELAAEKKREEEKKRSAWKTVDEERNGKDYVEDVNGSPMEDDLDGEEMIDDDLDGEPMEEDLDGVPMSDSDEAEPEREQVKADQAEEPVDSPAGLNIRAAEARRKRPRAMDMFADSDGE